MPPARRTRTNGVASLRKKPRWESILEMLSRAGLLCNEPPRFPRVLSPSHPTTSRIRRGLRDRKASPTSLYAAPTISKKGDSHAVTPATSPLELIPHQGRPLR